MSSCHSYSTIRMTLVKYLYTVQTGVIGICGRWPLAAPLLLGSRLAFMGREGKGIGVKGDKNKGKKRFKRGCACIV
jgi:hypothetical protein